MNEPLDPQEPHFSDFPMDEDPDEPISQESIDRWLYQGLDYDD